MGKNVTYPIPPVEVLLPGCDSITKFPVWPSRVLAGQIADTHQTRGRATALWAMTITTAR